jgi:hypothetical protein
MEATDGFEPPIGVLQTPALNHLATSPCVQQLIADILIGISKVNQDVYIKPSRLPGTHIAA